MQRHLYWQKTEEQFKDVQYPNKKEGTKGTHLVIIVDILNVFWLEIISMYLILPNITHKKHKDNTALEISESC